MIGDKQGDGLLNVMLDGLPDSIIGKLSISTSNKKLSIPRQSVTFLKIRMLCQPSIDLLVINERY